MRPIPLVAGKAALLVLAASGVMALSPGQAFATHVECGDVLTADTTLDSDLIDCPGDGLVIGADGITLDLDGHTVDGASSGGFANEGIDNGAGHDNVTIEDGVVQEFSTCAFLGGATGNRVDGLTIACPLGIVLELSSHNAIVHNSLSDGSFGILLSASHGNAVAENRTSGFSDVAILLADSTRNGVRFNSVTGGVEVGIGVDGGSDRNGIARNTVTSIGSTGLVAGTGMAIAGERNYVVLNTASHNEYGIVIGGPLPFGGSGRRTHVQKNVTAGNGVAGIFVNGGSAGTALLQNLATRNGDIGDEVSVDDGIHVEETNTKIRSNRADRNVDLGIEAVPGVFDGGFNKASGNGNPAQCTGVACSP